MKIGVFGVGHLGKIHLECLKQTPFEVVGFYDPDDRQSDGVSYHYSFKRYIDEASLIRECDAIDITAPSYEHFRIAMKALDMGKHVFIEKPLTTCLSDARILMEKVEDNNLIAQVGHVERYNPAFKSVDGIELDPVFIEAHRLSTFTARSTDISVILDLMIHDIDLVLSIVDQEVKDIQVAGVKVINNTPDICNARLTFAGGCVANLTASRISMNNKRKFRIFQKDAYINLDLLHNKSQIIALNDHKSEEGDFPIDTQFGQKYISTINPLVIHSNAIVDELNDFYSSIMRNIPPKVGMRDGYKAIELAERIETLLNIK